MSPRLLTALFLPKNKSKRDPLGPRGERIAHRYLRRRGYKTLLKNARVAPGEADLVCLAPDHFTIVVVEVKARRLSPNTTPTDRKPEAAITSHKCRKLIQIAETLAKKHHWQDRPIRIDVVAIDIPPKGKPAIRHYQRAVTR